MMKNKKGIGSFLKVGFTIFSFFFLLATALTMMITIYEGIGEYGIDVAVEVGTNISNDFGANNQTIINMQGLQQDYNDFSFPYDLYILALFVIGVSTIFESAYSARKLGIFSFIGMLFIGAQLFMLGVFFVEQALDWYFNEFFATLFSKVSLDLPISMFIFDNVSIIAIIIFFAAILINQLDIRTVLGQEGRPEE